MMINFEYPRWWDWSHVIAMPRKDEPLYCAECHTKWPCPAKVLMDLINALTAPHWEEME